MTTLRRIVLKRPKDEVNDVFEIEDNVKIDEPKGSEVLVKIKACVLDKINVDLLQEFKLIDKEIIGVGTEISGVIIQIGPDVSTLTVGDEVVGILPPNTDTYGCSSFCCVSEYYIVKKPSTVSHADAACCVGNGLKAYTALHYMANIAGGETVLVINGSRGAGIIAIQLAQLWGAKVITTANTEEEMIFLQSFQPEICRIIDFTKPQKRSLLGICLDETGGTGVDCIIDCGVQQFSEKFLNEHEKDSSLPSKHEIIMCLAVGGRWVTSQHDLQLDPPNTKVLYLKSATVSFLFKDSWTLSTGQQGRLLHILTDVLDKVAKGTIKPMVHHTVSFEDVSSTLENLHELTVGNVVLVM